MRFDRLDSQGNASEAERRYREGIRAGRRADVPTNRRAWVRTGLAAIALVVPLATWIVVTSTTGQARHARPLERVVADGAALQVHWDRTSCEQVDEQRTQVIEAQGEVVVTLWVQEPAGECTADDTMRVHRVELDEPLDDRDLIDGACLKPENRGHERCEADDAGGPTNSCRFCLHPEPAPSELPRVWPR